MASAVAINLRIYAKRLNLADRDQHSAANMMRFAADQIERQLKTLKKYRAERKKAAT